MQSIEEIGSLLLREFNWFFSVRAGCMEEQCTSPCYLTGSFERVGMQRAIWQRCFRRTVQSLEFPRCCIGLKIISTPIQ